MIDRGLNEHPTPYPHLASGNDFAETLCLTASRTHQLTHYHQAGRLRGLPKHLHYFEHYPDQEQHHCPDVTIPLLVTWLAHFLFTIHFSLDDNLGASSSPAAKLHNEQKRSCQADRSLPGWQHDRSVMV